MDVLLNHPLLILNSFLRALWAYPLDHVIDGVGFIAFWQLYGRYLYVVQANGLFAYLAMEVGMHIRHAAFMIAVACLVFEGGAVVYFMGDVVLLE